MSEKILSKFFSLALILYLSIFISLAFAEIPNAPYQANNYLMKDSLSKSTKEASLSLNAINGLSIDPFTGATNLNIPLITPPGRQGIKPSLILNYSTSNPNGPLGLGWRLEMGYIERSTKDGIPKYSQDDKFIFLLNGITSELVYVGGDTYRPKREPENYKFIFDGAYWKAKDKFGRTYYFGDRYNSNSVEQKSSSGIFRWYLVKVADMQGNYMVINYESGRCGSPSKIYYTRHTSNPSELAEIYIEFFYENVERQDIISNYRAGFYLNNSKGRLYEIRVWLKESSGNRLVKRYTFEYRYSSLTSRSLLAKITEYGSDGSASLPPITFTYQDTTEPNYTVTSLTDSSTYFADFNGDGLTDIGRFYNSDGKMVVRLSTSTGFAATSTWITGFGKDSQLLLGDFNADGRTDLCAFFKSKGRFYVALSDGSKFVNKGIWLDNFHNDYPAFVGEINADGLNDIITQTGTGTVYYAKSTGSSFIASGSDWWSSAKEKAFVGDFEGDGLSDICEYNAVSGDWYIRPLNKPSSGKTGFGLVGFGSGKEVFPADANNDGLTDAGYYDYSRGKVQVRIFTGRGFKETKELPFTFSLRDKNTKIQTADFNGDGLTDYAVYYAGKMEIAYSNGAFADLLNRVNNGIGGTLDLSYRPCSQYTNKRSDGTPGLPFVIPVFYQSKISDGQGNTYTTTYSYMAGLYDDAEREFAGFGYCRITEDEGNYTEQYFRQDKNLRGKLYKEMLKDKNGNTYTKSELVWRARELYPEVNLVYLEQRDDFTFDGDESFKQMRTRYVYDDYGNPTRISYDGELAVTGDEKTQVIQYTYNLLDWIVGLPVRTYILNENNQWVCVKQLYYDNATSYSTAPLKGLLTKEETWLYNPLTTQQSWISTAYEYDTFGNLIKTTDPLGRVTTIQYDTKLKIYPTNTTNALSQTTTNTYDYITGNILSTTDPNNQTTTYKYDPLGRLIRVISPNDNEAFPGMVYYYDLTSRPTHLTVSKRIIPLTASIYYTTHSYYDGLGRLIQTKSPAENDPATSAARQVVSDVVKFDAQGRVKEKYLPYFVSSSDAYSKPDYTQPKTSFAYDCLGRITQATNPDLTYSQNIYADWTTTFMDENGHITKQTQDAYGRIIKVEEYNGAQIYTTTYKYDALDSLIIITDNQNNATNFTYDSLVRRLRIDDPDMGVWNYAYDLVGNLIKQTDAQGQALEFEYDALNRLISKKGLSPSGTVPVTLANYFYDDTSKQYCIGRLSKVTDNSGAQEFFYDKLGRQIKFIQTVDGSAFSLEYAYDGLDRVTSLKYPDGETVNYAYNPAGAVESVKGDSTYASNVDYSPSGQIAKINYGNGASTDYTYQPQTLRLTNLITQSPTAKIQDLAYQFDKVGNINWIYDRVNTANNSAFLYDDLNRLIQARGRYGIYNYAYDSIGNMINKEGGTYTYGQAGKIPHALVQTSGGSKFTYDNNGNLIEEDISSRGKTKYYYDAENRLIKFEPQRQELSFAVNLKPGWNFISLPVVPKDRNIFQVLKGLKFGTDYDQVARYNAKTKTWEMFTNQPEFDQFFTIEYGKGYQIYVTNPNGVTLTVSGYLSVEETQFPISKGWNLIGFPLWANVSPVETGLKPLTLGGDYDNVEHYNPTTKTIEKYTASQKQFTEFKKGESYYLNALKDTNWKVPAQNTTIKEVVELNEFVYDYQGNRVKKITPSRGTTIYIGDLFEKVSSGVTRKHIFLGAVRVCTKVFSPNSNITNLYYYHTDHLGSSNVITDKDGNQLAYLEYSPYGSITYYKASASVPRYLFAGKELDTSLLYYYGSRYYHYLFTRFTQPDPILQNVYDPQSLNHYAYCRNNPLNLIDPTGTSWSSTWNSWSSSFSNTWNSWSSSINNTWNTGISTIGNWGMQVGDTLRDTWRSTMDWSKQQYQSFQQSISTLGSNLSNFGQSLGSSFSTFGSALGMGMNYGLGQVGSGLGSFQNSFLNSQMDTYKWMGQQAMTGINQFTSLTGSLINDYMIKPVSTGLNTLRNYGYVDIGVNLGAMGYGFTSGIKIAPSGVYFYSGIGSGFGFGISATYNIGNMPSVGAAFTGTASAGYLVGGRYRVSYANSNQSVSAGVGLGVGFSSTITTTYTIKIFPEL